MASNHTQNFHLNQWALSDDVRMEDFNADNAALESALSGMAQIATGSYVGTGEFGEEHPNVLTFNFEPLLVMIHSATGDETRVHMTAMRGQTRGNYQYIVRGNCTTWLSPTLTWGANSLSFCIDSQAYLQLNELDRTYYYVAFGLPAAQS